MTPITRDIFLKCAEQTASRFDVMHHTNHVALAFGAPVPAVAGRYFEVDAVAMRIAGELTPVLGRDDATSIVLDYWDKWLDAVGRADADERRMFFTVGVKDTNGAREREFLVTSGTAEECIEDFKSFNQDRAIIVNVSKIMAHIRELAREAGVDLSTPFFLPPDHPDYKATLKEAELIRATRLKRHREKMAMQKRRIAMVNRSAIAK